jgi:hypothetical protein
VAKKLHSFLKDREVKEFFIVCRIDDYSIMSNNRGGFCPSRGEYLGKGGYLWPTQQKAEEAAKYVLQKPENLGKQFGVFKLVGIVEQADVPIRVTKIT